MLFIGHIQVVLLYISVSIKITILLSNLLVLEVGVRYDDKSLMTMGNKWKETAGRQGLSVMAAFGIVATHPQRKYRTTVFLHLVYFRNRGE